MASSSHLHVANTDPIGDHSVRGGSVSCVRMSELRDHVVEGHSTRVGRHTIIFPTSGIGYHEVDSLTYEIIPGSVLYIEPGRVHRWLPDADFEGWSIAIDEHLCPIELFEVTGSSPLVVLGATIDVVKALVTSLTEPNLLPEGAHKRLNGKIAAVLLALIDGATGRVELPSESVAQQKLVGDFRQALEQNYTSIRSVVEYASLINCSAKTLSRATKSVLGQTPKEVIDLRVAYAACRLLSNTDLSVAWIAHSLGFSEQSNFAKFFTRLVGKSPAAYRASCLADR